LKEYITLKSVIGYIKKNTCPLFLSRKQRIQSSSKSKGPYIRISSLSFSYETNCV